MNYITIKVAGILKRVVLVSLLTAVSLGFYSCQQPAPKKDEAPEIAAKDLVSCDGIGDVKLTDSYQDLEKKFGAKNLTAHTNNSIGDYTTIWEDKPEQVNIHWKEKAAPLVHIAYMESVSPMASYSTKTGLMPGMIMKDVHEINSGMPLTFNNPYGGADAGLITSFNNGAIATGDPCIHGYVAVTTTRNIDAPTLNKFKEAPVVESSHPLMNERMDVIFERFKITAK